MKRPSDKSRTSGTHVYPRFGQPKIGRLFLLNVAVGLFAVTGLLTSMVSLTSAVLAALATGLSVAVTLCWPIWMMRRYYVAILTTRRAAWLGLGYSLGLFGVLLAIALVMLVLKPLDTTNWLRLGANLLADSIIAILFAIGWNLLQRWMPDLVRQNGTLCPTCAYCLVGVQSMRCPECGAAFSFADLETTEYEFQSRTERATSE
ncbi:MAG TPA: hypothetical protein P5081_12905 [Phycisphaerae bacterium]|nr:hypothetical protein [Phycisphaerae bacterium]HRW53777.1 hypothetical protein [Phycisphaerae bacterium]